MLPSNLPSRLSNCRGVAVRLFFNRRCLTQSTKDSKTSVNYTDVYVHRPYAYAFAKSPYHLQYKSHGQLLRERAATVGDKPAVISEHESLTKTFIQLDSEVDNLLYAFNHELGLRQGDVVALWTSNSYSSVLIQYACARYGLILCTLNPVYKSGELNYVLGKSEAKAIFLPGVGSPQEAVNQFTNILGQVDLNHANLKHVVYLDGDTSVNVPGLKSHSLKDLVDNGQKMQIPDVHVSPDDPLLMMFTSGTTGKPKGAALTHHSLGNVALLTAYRLNMVNTPPISCIPVPLFHVTGNVFGVVMMAQVGAPLILTGYRYSAQSVVNTINKHKSTHIMTVPAMVFDIMNYVMKEKVALPSLKTIIAGGAPIPVQLAKSFRQVVPNIEEFIIGYGSTETSGAVTMPVGGENFEDTVDNVGKPVDFVEVKIVDPKTGDLKKVNEKGELWARGHIVMLGYWKDDEKTKEVVTEQGWCKTGDVATLDENGRIRIVGRTKEMIIRGGENVYPAEVEQAIQQHPSVLAAAVCGVPDKRMGEEICAWVIPKPNTKPEPEEIRKFCEDKLSYFKVPRYVLIVDGLPVTPTGKPQKFKMTEESCKRLGIVE